MTPEEAAWVREHAWTDLHRYLHDQLPWVYTTCPCTFPPCAYCSSGRHDRCDGGPRYATWICYINPDREVWEEYVYEVGHPHPCACARGGHAGARPVQLDLFTLEGLPA